MSSSPKGVNEASYRDIISNNRGYNGKFRYANNHIKTSKYTILTFIPLNAFEQFQRLANFYFLCLLILQVIPVISSLTPVTTALPLIGVLSVTAIKDAYDDVQRHRTDRQVNNRQSKVLRRGQLIDEKWHRVQVGDVIRMENNQFIAADILLLSSSNPNGLCYIETAELDGETNLKSRMCSEDTNMMADNNEVLGNLDCHILCEPPNNNLSKFTGSMTWDGNKYPLDNEQILLRGTVLRNTAWCYGIVIFAGKDTKLMQNSGKTKLKRTSIDKLLNFIIIGIVFFLLCVCLFCTIACGVWETLTGYNFQIYLPWDTLIPKDLGSGATLISLLVFFSYAIVLNTVVPISLYVSVEVIRFGLSFLISWDLQMYDEKSDTPACARTTTLNEELGQIQYIFSDKTGTLTQNIMTFNKCSVKGRVFGEEEKAGSFGDRAGRGAAAEVPSMVDFSANPMYEPSFEFYDQSLLDEVRRGDPDTQDFFRLLAVCHTVMPNYQSEEGSLEYQAQSPDENALVSAARNFGFVFTQRTPSSITITFSGQEEKYDLLCILDFNNVRKRMSVILKRAGRIRLYCKGADTVIFPRLKPGQNAIVTATQEHLDRFASDGLRTLVLGTKYLTQAEFDSWKAAHHEAALALENREEKLDAVYDEIERGLELLGATAIEDKLQDGVGRTIHNLMSAGIRVWVLTGDKQETAINIGYSCQLLSDDMQEEPFIVDGTTHQQVEAQFRQHLDTLKRSKSSAENDRLADTDKLQRNYTSHPDSLSMSTLSDASSLGAPSMSTYSPYHCPRGSVDITDNASAAAAAFNRAANDISVVKDPDKIEPMGDGSGGGGGGGGRGEDSMVDDGGGGGGGGEMFSTSGGGGTQALVVNGHSLVFALSSSLEKAFLDVAENCSAVICCRVTPLQKAMVVELVKKHKKAVTLAIGDGANDVSMIKTAHIGVGISGQEGMQAVLASDYSISQFRFLERLLLVHGRWSYYRMCKFLRYFFYKNFAFTLCHFWYAFFCGFSAQTLFEPMFIAVYNLFYTSQPVLAMGIFDQDVDANMSLKLPKLYAPGLKSSSFNKREFFRSALQGFLTSCVLFFLTYGAYGDKILPGGITISDHQLFGTIVATSLVIVVNAQVALDSSYWTYFNHITIWGSIAFYFVLQFSYNYIIGGAYLGALSMALSDYTFWLTCVLITVVSLLPVVAFRFYKTRFTPNLSDKARLLQKHSSSKHKREFKPFSGKGGVRRSTRSAYAFAHEEGFGKLITSGKIMQTREFQPKASMAAAANAGATTMAASAGIGVGTGRRTRPGAAAGNDNTLPKTTKQQNIRVGATTTITVQTHDQKPAAAAPPLGPESSTTSSGASGDKMPNIRVTNSTH